MVKEIFKLHGYAAVNLSLVSEILDLTKPKDNNIHHIVSMVFLPNLHMSPGSDNKHLVNYPFWFAEDAWMHPSIDLKMIPAINHIAKGWWCNSEKKRRVMNCSLWWITYISQAKFQGSANWFSWHSKINETIVAGRLEVNLSQSPIIYT